jgi:hypothetical protein
VASVYGTKDYMAVKFTPNFVGDRILAVVSANTTGVYRQLLKTSDPATVYDTDNINTTTGDYSTAAGAYVAQADIPCP